MEEEPGGECEVPSGDGGLPRDQRTRMLQSPATDEPQASGCTWHAIPIGEVLLSELEGGPEAALQPGGQCFWKDHKDPVRNRERVQRLAAVFREKYPDIPDDIPAPRCPY